MATTMTTTTSDAYRPAINVQPGWEVYADDTWIRVTGWFRFDSPKYPSIVVLRFADGSEARAWATDELFTRK